MPHLIGHIGFEFSAQCEDFATDLHTGWERFFSGSVEPILRQTLDRYDLPGLHREIPYIELHLGRVDEKDFTRRFRLRFRECLEEYFRGLPVGAQDGVREEPEGRHALDLLIGFLLKGTFAHGELARYGGSLRSLFLFVVRHEGSELSRTLRTYGHYTGFQERLVRQLDDPELEQGVRLLTPSDSGVICAYIGLLRRKYSRIDRPAVTEDHYRYAVWRVMYTYLLNDRGTVFNRKDFLSSTVGALSARLNMDFATFIRILTDELGRMYGEEDGLPELLRLLGDLRRESDDRERGSLLRDTGSLFKTVALVIRQSRMSQMSPWFVPLKTLLENQDSSGHLLRMLGEKEIRALVPLIVPRQAEFVTAYADALEEEKGWGAFEGKTGSDFNRVKWMFIFTVLMQNRGTGFNRRYFVEQVLLRLAARYNLRVDDLLDYFLKGNLAVFDRDLLRVFQSLRRKYGLFAKALSTTLRWESRIRELLRHPGRADDTDRKKMRLFFSREDLRQRWLPHLSPPECVNLLFLLTSSEARFFGEYADRLDTLKNIFSLEGRDGSTFFRVKWEFMLRILIGEVGSTIGRKRAVARILSGLAVHYDFSYTEFLVCFATHPTDLPVILKPIMEELLKEECDRLLRFGGPEKWASFLNYFPNTASCMRTFDWKEAVYTIARSFKDESGITGRDMEFLFIKLLTDRIIGIWLQERPLPAPDQMLERAVEELALRFGFSARRSFRRWQEMSVKKIGNAPSDSPKETPADVSVRPPSSGNNRRPERPILLFPADTPANTPVVNAGMVLFGPFYPRLFRMLEYLGKDGFTDEKSRTRAVFLLQYAVSGQSCAPEYDLYLNKILTGYLVEIPIPKEVELSEKEKAAVADMLTGASANWPELKNTSAEGMRQSFLRRFGIVEVHNDKYVLKVEEKAYDLLLDSCPWSFRTIKFPWMDRRVEVKWRC